jgi:hypothetical protein
MEPRYVYSWRLRPRRGFEVELRVEAPSAIAARREVAIFLEHHDGLAWTLFDVQRWTSVESETPVEPVLRFAPDR